MKNKEKVLRIILVVLAVAIPLVSVIYTTATGNYFSEIGSNVMASVSHLLLIGALLIGIDRNPKSKPAKIGIISGLTVLMFLRWS
jgi:hypothetical protein